MIPISTDEELSIFRYHEGKSPTTTVTWSGTPVLLEVFNMQVTRLFLMLIVNQLGYSYTAIVGDAEL